MVLLWLSFAGLGLSGFGFIFLVGCCLFFPNALVDVCKSEDYNKGDSLPMPTFGIRLRIEEHLSPLNEVT